jgi:hypothetical protein
MQPAAATVMTEIAGGTRARSCATATTTRAGPIYSTARVWFDGIIDPRGPQRAPPSGSPPAQTRGSTSSDTACSRI